MADHPYMVEVHRITAVGPDEWWAAKVVGFNDINETLAVELLHGREFNPGQNRMWLRKCDQGTTWR